MRRLSLLARGVLPLFILLLSGCFDESEILAPQDVATLGPDASGPRLSSSTLEAGGFRYTVLDTMPLHPTADMSRYGGVHQAHSISDAGAIIGVSNEWSVVWDNSTAAPREVPFKKSPMDFRISNSGVLGSSYAYGTSLRNGFVYDGARLSSVSPLSSGESVIVMGVGGTDGKVAVGFVSGYKSGTGSYAYGFRWSAETGLRKVASHPTDPNNSQVRGISEDGTMYGSVYVRPYYLSPSYVVRAAVWSPSGVMSLVGKYSGTYVNDRNAAGFMVGTGGGGFAVVWTPDGTEVPLLLPAGGRYPNAYDIDDQNRVIGTYVDASNRMRYGYWTSPSQFTEFPLPEGLRAFHMYRDANAKGQVLLTATTPEQIPYYTSYRHPVIALVVEGLTGTGSWGSSVTPPPVVQNQPPVAALTAPSSVVEGSSVTFSAAGSSDPEGGRLSYAWTFSPGGGTASGAQVSRVYADQGVVSATVVVTDSVGAADTATVQVTVTNAAPVVSPGPAVTIESGDTAKVSASFQDAGAQDGPWSVSFSWSGTAGASGPVSTQGTVSDSRVLMEPGSYTVTVSVTDKDGATTSTQIPVTVTAMEVSLPSAEEGFTPPTVSMSGAGATSGKSAQPVDLVIPSSARLDMTRVRVESVRLGAVGGASVGVEEKGKKQYFVWFEDFTTDGRVDAKFRFRLNDLVNAGAITSQTRELLFQATMQDGRKIETRIPIQVQ